MALQDLTPQLRTRLSRMERAVGWFVVLATGLLLFGFGYYVYKTAETKGWFLRKIAYQTCVSSGTGLKVGDPVRLMGFDVGQITAIIPNDPYAYYNITIQFRVKVDRDNYEGYIWSDSKVKVAAGDFLGNRYLEITKGIAGVPTVLLSTNNDVLGVLRDNNYVKARVDALLKEGRSNSEALATVNKESRENPSAFYVPFKSARAYFLDPEEAPALTERLDQIVSRAEAALPNILNLTNQIAGVLSNTLALTANLDALTRSAQPAVSNLALVSVALNQPGGLGTWLLPTNLNSQLDITVASVNTNLASLSMTLDNLANVTSNLNRQVQANTNILSSISTAIQDADNFVQGLKKHWLLRSAFKTPATNAPPKSFRIYRSPKDGGPY
ncbi:MAG: MlaD family protein [Verrucomicrobiota bacterium]